MVDICGAHLAWLVAVRVFDQHQPLDRDQQLQQRRDRRIPARPAPCPEQREADLPARVLQAAGTRVAHCAAIENGYSTQPGHAHQIRVCVLPVAMIERFGATGRVYKRPAIFDESCPRIESVPTEIQGLQDFAQCRWMSYSCPVALSQW